MNKFPMTETSPITHVTFSPLGGAGAVAVRLAAAQRQLGLQVKLVPLVNTPFPRWAARHPLVAAAALTDYYLVRKDTESSFFSLFRRQHAKRIAHRISRASGILHLHLLNGFLWPPTLFSLPLNAHKVVWSVQDLWPFTGGCHYANECTGFMRDCTGCPQVRPIFQQQVANCLQEKREGLQNHPHLRIVTPSEWARSLVQSSTVMRNLAVDVIPNPVDVRQFTPLDPVLCRRRWKIHPEAFVIGVGAANIRDERKRIPETLRIIGQWMRQSPPLRPVQVLVFGGGGSLSGFPPEFVFTGPSASAAVMSEWYNAMDLYVSLSRFETFGNTLAEAGACETPSICLTGSGMAEVVRDGHTGYHVRSPEDLPPAITALYKDPALLGRLGSAAREHAVRHFDDDVIARQFTDIYEST